MEHYPKGYRPQTYGEKDIADGMTREQIKRVIDDKERMKKEEPKRFKRLYKGFGM